MPREYNRKHAEGGFWSSMRKQGLAIFILAGILGTGIASSQQPAPGGTPGGTPGPTPGGTPGPGSPGGTPGNIPGRPGQPGQFPGGQPGQQFPEMRRPIFLSGKVQMADGSPLPEPVAIERVCNGVARVEGFTNAKGSFNIELGRNANMFMDASQGSFDGTMSGASQGSFGGLNGANGPNQGISERDLFGCELRAQLPGFRSDVVTLANRRAFDNPDLGIILMHRMGNVQGLTVSATTAAAPKEAQKAFEKGRKAFDKQKYDDAQRELAKAVEIYPKYAVAWSALGRTYEARKEYEEARKAYQSALAADSKLVPPYEGLYMIAVREANWKDVADTTDTIIRLNPFDFPHAFYFNAIARLNLNDLPAAEKSCREFLKMDKQRRLPKASYVLGIILAQKAEYGEAAQHLKSFLEAAPNAKEAETVRRQLAEVEKFAKATPQQ